MKTALRILISLHIVFSVYTQPASLTSAKDYKNISGNQIYLFEMSNAFSYISIDVTQTTKLKATIYLYINQSITAISNGVYTSIGFGTSQMSGSDIVLCAVKSDKSCWCKDYNGVKENINPKSTTLTTLISSKVDTLGDAWAPYKTLITFNIERTMTVADILNGNVSAISAYGSLNSSGAPIEHTKYYSFKTGDGSNMSNSNTNSISISLGISMFALIMLIFN